eukprot:3622329-Alexandrium_andersonii.AAC.1
MAPPPISAPTLTRMATASSHPCAGRWPAHATPDCRSSNGVAVTEGTKTLLASERARQVLSLPTQERNGLDSW